MSITKNLAKKRRERLPERGRDKELKRFLALTLLLLFMAEGAEAASFSLVSVPYYNIEGYPLVSCISMVLGYFGTEVDQEELKTRLVSSGIENPFNAVDYMDSKGFKMYVTQLQIREIKNLIDRSEIPVIVGQSFRRPYDYIYWRVVIGFDDEKGIITNDPILRNNYQIAEDKFNSLWVREAPNITIVIVPKDKKLSITENNTVKNAMSMYFSAISYISKSDWKSARAELEKYLKIYPDNPLGLNAYAYVLLQLGELENAKGAINKVLPKYPLPFIYDTAGLIYWKLNEIDRAEQYFYNAYISTPSNREIVKNYANFLIAQAKIDEAKGILNSYLLIQPEDGEIKSLLDSLNSR
jgi:tetratricopeptide (TPR) repeat protein